MCLYTHLRLHYIYVLLCVLLFIHHVYVLRYMCPPPSKCVFILIYAGTLNTGGPTIIYVYYCCIYVLLLLYMCPPPTHQHRRSY